MVNMVGNVDIDIAFADENIKEATEIIVKAGYRVERRGIKCKVFDGEIARAPWVGWQALRNFATGKKSFFKGQMVEAFAAAGKFK